MTFDEDEVREKLRKVEDPELGEDIVKLEMVESIEVDGSVVELEIDLPNESIRDDLRDAVQSALAEISGV
ncbi:MAG: iron-sulfur cluster assembly protein, partial [Halobacteria archaeon]|nr:iron-sulfur cluster assembly protein [Halobacteria archaeon]